VKLFCVLVAVLGVLASASGVRAAEVRADEVHDEVHTATIAPAVDLSFPYSCSWGYDWDERCYRDDSDRLPFGGAGDKTWRAALRFPLAALPPGALVLTAELSLYYDGVCVAPLRRTVPCDGRAFAFEAHPVYTARWATERELEYGPAVGWAWLDAAAEPEWVTWDVTDTVGDWMLGVPNNGFLLRLLDGTESLAVGGPAFPSSSFPETSVRPRLTVWYLLE
jgi:hypothetical protein